MLPRVLRLISLQTQEQEKGRLTFTAQLYHDSAQMRVRWSARQIDVRLRHGVLVSPRWTGPGRSEQGCLLIARLAVMERPVTDCALFETVPPGWAQDRNLIRRARALLGALPPSYRQLFDAIFWDADRFRGLCTGPSSMQGHHAERCGNLRHTVEVAEQVRALCLDRAYVHRDLAVLSALLHDAGKAVEYRVDRDGNWTLTDRGRLLGHRVTAIEWIAAALGRWGIRLPDGHAEVLLHNLSRGPRPALDGAARAANAGSRDAVAGRPAVWHR
jgi:3'-5' exoribonuclease